MDNSKLTSLPAAETPISGDALIYMVQSGNSVQAAVSELPSGGENWIGDPLATEHGGTSATTAADARTNLGAASQADLTAVQGDIVDLENQISTLSVSGLPAFPDTAAGISGTSSGEYFQIIGTSGSSSAATIYLNNSGSAVLQSSIASLAFVLGLSDQPLNILAALGGDLAGIYTSDEGDVVPDAASFPGVGNFGPIHPVPFAVNGILSKISVRTAGSGAARILTRDPQTEKVTWTADVALVAGVNELLAGADYPVRFVNAGEQLIYYPLSGSGAAMRVTNSGGASSLYAQIGTTPPDVGDVIANGAITPYANFFAFEYENISAQNPAGTDLPIRSRKQVMRETFPGTSFPAGWTFGPNYLTNNGLNASATGGDWTNVATQNVYTASANVIWSTRFTVNNTGCIQGLASKPNPAGNLFFGGAVVVNGGSNRLGIYPWTGGASLGTVIIDTAIPALTLNTPYILSVEVDDLVVSASLLNTVTGVTTSVSTNFYASGGDCASFKGGCTISQVAGSASYQWVQLDQGFSSHLKGIYVGDSNMAATVSPTIGQSWAMQLQNLRPQKDIMVSAVGGDSGQWLTRQDFDFDAFGMVDQVVFAVGSNYTTLAAWRTDMQQMIDIVTAAGSEAIICTQVPCTGKQSLMNDMNADILSGYFGNRRIVDIAAAVTTGGDRINWATGLNEPDGIHMSLDGQIAAFEWAKANNPYLWLDAPNYFLSLS